jgi:hypothetical protein
MRLHAFPAQASLLPNEPFATFPREVVIRGAQTRASERSSPRSIMVDRDLVDGAPARFAHRLQELMESATGLSLDR